MFIVIEPKDQHLHKATIEPIMKLIKDNSLLSWSFQNHANTTFIVCSDESRNIYGGALILKQPFAFLHQKIQKNIANLGLKKEVIWICTLFLRKENHCFSQHFEFFFETFYRNLYMKFVEFGMKEDASFLYMMLEPGEYLCSEALGCWPYVLQNKSIEFLNDLSHSILSLTGAPSKTQVKTGGKMFSEEMKLAA